MGVGNISQVQSLWCWGQFTSNAMNFFHRTRTTRWTSMPQHQRGWKWNKKCNAVCPTLTPKVTSGVKMPQEWHVLTRDHTVLPDTHTFIYECRKHSPDGATRARQLTSGSAYYSSIDLESMKDWVGLVGWPCSGRLTHISSHPSPTGWV